MHRLAVPPDVECIFAGNSFLCGPFLWRTELTHLQCISRQDLPRVRCTCHVAAAPPRSTCSGQVWPAARPRPARTEAASRASRFWQASGPPGRCHSRRRCRPHSFVQIAKNVLWPSLSSSAPMSALVAQRCACARGLILQSRAVPSSPAGAGPPPVQQAFVGLAAARR